MGRDHISSHPPRPSEELTPIVGFAVPVVGEKRPCLVVLAGPLIGEVYAAGPEGLLIGRDPQAKVRVMEEGVSRRHAQLVVEGGAARVVDLGSTNGTWVNGHKITSQALNDGDRVRLGQTTVFKFTYHDRMEEQLQRQLLEAALRDALTRAFNRRYFLQRLASEMAYASRHGAPLGLVLLDIDHFKAVNDTYGHPVGDQILKRVSEVLFSKIRMDDVLARYGGEEFAVIARDTNLESTLRLAERLRAAVIEATFEHDGRPLEIRVSLGASALPYDGVKEPEQLIELADQALYRAKRGGRNRVAS